MLFVLTWIQGKSITNQPSTKHTNRKTRIWQLGYNKFPPVGFRQWQMLTIYLFLKLLMLRNNYSFIEPIMLYSMLILCKCSLIVLNIPIFLNFNESHYLYCKVKLFKVELKCGVFVRVGMYSWYPVKHS